MINFTKAARLAIAAGIWMAAGSIISNNAFAGEKMARDGLTVVELFTSQGCASCPPADALLGELIKNKNILGLSFHVDYWDYIGWKDPYAKSAFTKRQRDYSKAFGTSFIYTPQMVIHGTLGVTGSEARQVKSGIKSAKKGRSYKIRMYQTEDGDIKISLSRTDHKVNTGIWFVTFDPQHTTKVKRGENRGATIINYNVVRHFRKLGTWRGGDFSITIPSIDLQSDAGGGRAVFLQKDRKGPILGAAALLTEPQR